MLKPFKYIYIACIASVLIACNSLKAITLNWEGGKVIENQEVEQIGINQCFSQELISDSLFANMKEGGTWKEDTPDSLRYKLRYLRILHCNADKKPQMGEMIVNELIADKVLRIFRKLYEEGYIIERMVLMDRYNADDETAMRNNNTSCFNFRFKSNSNSEISKHGFGLAIDINTLYNPYVKAIGLDEKTLRVFNYEERHEGVSYDFEPATGEPYAFDRSRRNDIPYKIDETDLAYKLFAQEGFDWGGNWITRKDYQHFEYPTQ